MFYFDNNRIMRVASNTLKTYAANSLFHRSHWNGFSVLNMSAVNFDLWCVQRELYIRFCICECRTHDYLLSFHFVDVFHEFITRSPFALTYNTQTHILQHYILREKTHRGLSFPFQMSLSIDTIRFTRIVFYHYHQYLFYLRFQWILCYCHMFMKTSKILLKI